MGDWALLLPLLAVPIVLLFRFVGCSSFGTAPEEAFGFTLGLEKTEVSLTQGGTAQVKLTITAVGTFANDTTLSMTPLAGVTGTFGPNPVNPHGGSLESLLTLSAAPTASVGTSVVTISATAAGAAASSPPITHVASLTINVTAMPATPPADFSLALMPPSLSARRGTTAVFTVNINRTGGFAEAITLSIAPAGPVTFTPNPATGGTSTLNVPLPANAPLVTQSFTVIGTGTSGATRSTTGTLTITP